MYMSLQESTKTKLKAIAENTQNVYDNGFANGEMAGKTKEWEEFWDVFQTKGSRTNYIYGFGGYGWADINFKPKYDIKPTGSASGLFYGSRINDLEAKLEQCGVILDTSNCTSLVDGFRESRVIYVPELDCSRVEPDNLQGLFKICTNLDTVRKIKLGSIGNHTFTDTFHLCTGLYNIEFEGIIGRSVSFRWSPLSVASLKSIIKHLYNHTGTSNDHAYTLTFKSSAFSALEAKGLTDEDKEWFEDFENFVYSDDTTWATVIDDLGWNLTLA